MLPRLQTVSADQSAVFTAAQAQAAGYSDDEVRARVRAGEWVALRRGIYVTSDAYTAATPEPVALHRLFAAAGVLALDPGAALSHISAAVMYGFSLRSSPGRLVHTTRPEGPPRRYRQLIVHQVASSPDDVTTIGSIPLTTPARSVLDCADLLSFADGVVVADSALATGVVTKDELTEVLAEFSPRRARRAGRVVDFADGASESPGESLSRVLFDAQGLPAPELQAEVFHRGVFVARTDFLWRKYGVIGEFDGRMKYVDDSTALWREKLREDRLRALGYEVVRFTWDEVIHHPERVAARIRAAFARAAENQRRTANLTH